MMLQEFIDRTGFEPTDEEYSQIEQEYYRFDGNKDAYCKQFVENGGAARYAKARAERIRQLDGRILEMEHDARLYQKQLQNRIAELEAELEREQEWKPYDYKGNVSQADYTKLADGAEGGRCSHYMTDDEAKEWVCDEFGFNPAKVTILHEVYAYEINRHGQLRRTGKMLDRRPVYCATDYQYIRFDVNGCWMYECWNDELLKFSE